MELVASPSREGRGGWSAKRCLRFNFGAQICAVTLSAFAGAILICYIRRNWGQRPALVSGMALVAPRQSFPFDA